MTVFFSCYYGGGGSDRMASVCPMLCLSLNLSVNLLSVLCTPVARLSATLEMLCAVCLYAIDLLID